MTAEELIDILGLKPLPMEGGYFRETYRSQDTISGEALPDRYSESKSLCTAIYYLLTPDTCSKIHRLPTDEIFHFYLGDPVYLLQLWPDGTSKSITLGTEIHKGQQVQLIVPHGVWQGSFLLEGGKFALMGTTVSPGFDFSDYESADRDELTRRFPEDAELIEKLTD